MRFMRLVVACLAFVLAQPTGTAFGDSVGRVVVVAAQVEERPRERLDDTRPVEIAVDAHVRRPRARARAVDEATTTRALAAVQSPRVFVDRKYLRHCSLLR